MPKIQITSSKYPSIGLLCPQIPERPEMAGTFQFQIGTTYAVTDETYSSLGAQVANMPPYIGDLRLVLVSEDSGTAEVVTAPAPATVPEIADDPVVHVPDITELTDEDIDLVGIEVGKLLGLTVKQAEPILVATGGSPDLPRTLRVLYLEEVQKHPDVQKSLKDVAEKLLEQI
jgi:hypothetical protein